LRQASDPVLVGRRLLYEIRPDLAALRGMVVRWRFARADFALVAPGLERTCRQVRRRSRQAQREGTDERCHDWRKSLKYLWFQLYVFEPVVGGSELIEACRRAATDLGADHDHALLAGLAPAHLDPVAAQRAVAVLQAAGARRRADAVATARPICAMAPMELSAR
ncbi:MAG: CHAD domain-containing protein, partial [Planctomycetota bacterium]